MTEPQADPRLGIYARALLLVGFVLAAAMTAVTVWIIHEDRDLLTRELESRVIGLAQQQAASVAHPLWDLNRAATHTALQGLAQDQDFVSAVVRDEKERIFASSVLRDVPDALLVHHTTPVVLAELGRSRNIGTLTLALSRERLLQRQTKARDNAILLGGILLLVTVAAVAVVLRAVLNPLAGLSERMLGVSAGDLTSDVPYRDRADQIGGLARAVDAFRRATADRVSAQEALRRAHDEMEHRVEERTAELRRTELLFRSFIAETPAEVFARDLNGCMILVNRAWERTQGIREEDAIGKPISQLLPVERAKRYVEQDQTVLESGDSIDTVITQPFENETRLLHTIKFPLLDSDGKIMGVGGITSDVTETHQAEERLQQAQKMEAVGQLTGGVAHDFNNLLAVIQGNADLLAEQVGRDDEYLQPIVQAARRGGELTQRLLAFSRRQPLRSKEIDVGELVTGMTELIVRTLGETFEIHTVLEPDLWRASADPGQVENALINLAINARDAMPHGGKITIECSNTTLDSSYVAQNIEAVSGDYVVLSVTDEGTGMLPDVKARAFEPFFTTKPVGKGSGLGLSMIYGFAKQSGGQLTIYSEVDQGTTVKLYLPRAGVQPDAGEDATARAPAVAVGRGELILVVEDDPQVRVLAVHLLRRLGYRVIDAADAADGHAVLARGEHVDLVLSDVVLPGGTSGPEFAEQVHASDPNVKFIFMSGYPAEAARRNGFLGSDRVLLNKPFQTEDLAKVVRSALDEGGG